MMLSCEAVPLCTIQRAAYHADCRGHDDQRDRSIGDGRPAGIADAVDRSDRRANKVEICLICIRLADGVEKDHTNSVLRYPDNSAVARYPIFCRHQLKIVWNVTRLRDLNGRAFC